MKKSALALIAVLVVIVIWGFSGYNGLVSLNENADAQWAKVETQYQRRFDLIPNLVNSVKGILNQEQTVFGDIAEARTRYAGATTPDAKAAAASDVESALGRLLVVVENYPQLQSSANVRDLMTQLEGTENRISVERTRFNDVVLAYNTAIKRFPRNLLAGIMGFHERSYFKAANGAEVAPAVNL
ncbi:LemA family protein [Candidatus Parcubacteria bacterium]|nr:LemA family protein [Candidatus Parcubacteria bacterium]